MSPEKQRIAIAEACGINCRYYPIYTLPDYLGDLNEFHETEKSLKPDQWNAYVNHLNNVVNPDGEIDGQPELDFRWVTATAKQRSEAFLRTIGKWEESA